MFTAIIRNEFRRPDGLSCFQCSVRFYQFAKTSAEICQLCLHYATFCFHLMVFGWNVAKATKAAKLLYAIECILCRQIEFLLGYTQNCLNHRQIPFGRTRTYRSFNNAVIISSCCKWQTIHINIQFECHYSQCLAQTNSRNHQYGSCIVCKIRSIKNLFLTPF